MIQHPSGAFLVDDFTPEEVEDMLRKTNSSKGGSKPQSQTAAMPTAAIRSVPAAAAAASSDARGNKAPAATNHQAAASGPAAVKGKGMYGQFMEEAAANKGPTTTTTTSSSSSNKRSMSTHQPRAAGVAAPFQFLGLSHEERLAQNFVGNAGGANRVQAAASSFNQDSNKGPTATTSSSSSNKRPMPTHQPHATGVAASFRLPNGAHVPDLSPEERDQFAQNPFVNAGGAKRVQAAASSSNQDSNLSQEYGSNQCLANAVPAGNPSVMYLNYIDPRNPPYMMMQNHGASSLNRPFQLRNGARVIGVAPEKAIITGYTPEDLARLLQVDVSYSDWNKELEAAVSSANHANQPFSKEAAKAIAEGKPKGDNVLRNLDAAEEPTLKRPHPPSTILTPEEEKIMIHIAKDRMKHGKYGWLEHEDYQQIARDLYKARHPDKKLYELPSFSKDWFRNFVSRWPNEEELWKHLPPTRMRKTGKPHRSEIKTALKQLKEQLDSFALPCPLTRVYFVTDVVFHVGGTTKSGIMPARVDEADLETSRVTVLTFANLYHGYATGSFIIQNKEPGSQGSEDASAWTKLLYNSSGSSECDKGGDLGSYHLAVQEFVKYVDLRHHKGERVVLITDSKPVHLQESVKKTLEENNIHQIALAPELAKLVQSDNVWTFYGCFKQNLVDLKWKTLTNLNRGVTVQEFCRNAERQIFASHDAFGLFRAASDFGLDINFNGSGEALIYCQISEATIECQLDKFEKQGWIEDEDDEINENGSRDRESSGSSSSAYEENKRLRTRGGMA